MENLDGPFSQKNLERRLPALAPATTNLSLRTQDVPSRVELVLVDPPDIEDDNEMGPHMVGEAA